MSATALNPSQFNVERSIIEQGNPDALTARVRGIQNMTSNVYKPSFSSDLTTVRSMPSGTADGLSSRTAGAVEQGEDDEEA
jgi:hypothetical protein